MLGIYFFENTHCFDGELRQHFESVKLTLNYENVFHKFLSKLKNFKPNFVVLSFENVFWDEIFSDIFSINSEFFVPYVLVLSNSAKKLSDLPNTYVVMTENKNLELKKFLGQFQVLLKDNMFLSPQKETRNQFITKLLNHLKFSTKLNGTLYLKDAIRLYACENMRCQKSVSSILEEVATLHNTKAINVERCLRSLVGHMWQNEFACEFKSFFPKRPSTKELIRSLAEYVLEHDCFETEKLKSFA